MKFIVRFMDGTDTVIQARYFTVERNVLLFYRDFDSPEIAFASGVWKSVQSRSE